MSLVALMLIAAAMVLVLLRGTRLGQLRIPTRSAVIIVTATIAVGVTAVLLVVQHTGARRRSPPAQPPPAVADDNEANPPLEPGDRIPDYLTAGWVNGTPDEVRGATDLMVLDVFQSW